MIRCGMRGYALDWIRHPLPGIIRCGVIGPNGLMYAAVALPYWNSLDSIKRITHGVEIGTLLCWVLLVIFEVIAHFWEARKRIFSILALFAFALAVMGEITNFRYTARKDQLTDKAEVQLAQIASDATRDVYKANAEADAVQQRLDLLKKQMKWRQVTAIQGKTLNKYLSPFKGTNVVIVYILTGGDETQQYSEQIGRALRDAGWSVALVAGTHDGPPRYDLTVAVNDKMHPHPATVLLDALRKAQFPDVEGQASAQLTRDQIQIVGRPKRPLFATTP